MVDDDDGTPGISPFIHSFIRSIQFVSDLLKYLNSLDLILSLDEQHQIFKLHPSLPSLIHTYIHYTSTNIHYPPIHPHQDILIVRLGGFIYAS